MGVLGSSRCLGQIEMGIGGQERLEKWTIAVTFPVMTALTVTA